MDCRLLEEKDMEQFKRRCRSFFDTLWPAEEKPLVFGEGKCDRPPVMLIGEAPGEQESLQGRPFVGKAGKNLDGFLQAIALRREDIYITNVVKVRPTRVSARGSVSNRPPNREELLLFTPFLYEEIQLVRPGLMVTLGNVALQALMGPQATVGAFHGKETEAAVRVQGREERYPLFPLYHPASIIYNRSLTEVYQEDLRGLRAWLTLHGSVN